MVEEAGSVDGTFPRQQRPRCGGAEYPQCVSLSLLYHCISLINSTDYWKSKKWVKSAAWSFFNVEIEFQNPNNPDLHFPKYSVKCKSCSNVKFGQFRWDKTTTTLMNHVNEKHKPKAEVQSSMGQYVAGGKVNEGLFRYYRAMWHASSGRPFLASEDKYLLLSQRELNPKAEALQQSAVTIARDILDIEQLSEGAVAVFLQVCLLSYPLSSVLALISTYCFARNWKASSIYPLMAGRRRTSSLSSE
jgi:hypothetical protein